MSFAAIGSGVTAGSTNTHNVTTGAIDTTGADLLVGVVADNLGQAATTISDLKSNIWTLLASYAIGNARCRIFYATSVSGKVGTGHTFTAAGSSAFPSIAVRPFSGAHLIAPFDLQDGDNTPNAATTALAATGITPGANNYLVIAGTGWETATALPTINGGFSTPLGTAFSSGVNFGCALSYLIQTSAAAARPTWTYNLASNGGNALASFKVAGAGGGGSTLRTLGALGVGA